MKNSLYIFAILLFLISCKKETSTPPNEYQETRNARITQLELTDKDFRQYFKYREDGLLDSVKREGAIMGSISKPSNWLFIQHYDDHIKVNTIHDYNGIGNWMDVKFFTQNNKINGSQFSIQPLPAPSIYSFLKINYSADNLINVVESGVGLEPEYYPFMTNIIFNGNKITEFKVVDPQYYLMLEFLNYADYDLTISYKPNKLISPDIIKLLNNSHVQFVNAGEVVDGWQSLIYGFSGYKLPIQEDEELISQIQYRAFSKEDGSLILDSTVVFDYQVDTLLKKISFGNQIITYEFTE